MQTQHPPRPLNKGDNNYLKSTMENKNKSIWSEILKIAITVLTALATVFGVQACC